MMVQIHPLQQFLNSNRYWCVKRPEKSQGGKEGCKGIEKEVEESKKRI